MDEDAVGMQYGSTLQTFLAGVVDSLGKPLKLPVRPATAHRPHRSCDPAPP